MAKEKEIKVNSFADLRKVIKLEDRGNNRTTICKFCKKRIEFVPDPQKPGMFVPVNCDDKQLHFNTCKKP